MAQAALLWGRAAEAIMAGGDQWRQFQVIWPKHALSSAVQRPFPTEWLDGTPMPCVEDIASMDPVQEYAEWIVEQDQQLGDLASAR
eukprot:297426-Heterocapsa_arctica.AAC.1